MRENKVARRRSAREAVLEWLYEETYDGRPQPVISDFAKSGYGLFYGDPFTEHETSAATNWLKERGYIRGTGSMGHGLPRPVITAQGESVADAGRSVNADAFSSLSADASPTNVTITGSHNVNVATHSPGSSQVLNVSAESKRQVLQVADALRDGLPLLGLDADTERQAPLLVEELRSAAEARSPDPGRLRQLLGRAQEVAVSGTGTAIGSALAALATQALQQLG